MKTDAFEAVAIAEFALASGVKLMAGGMVESRTAMGCSFSLVLGMKRFDILDLNTSLPLSLRSRSRRPRYQGPLLEPWQEPGLALTALREQRISTID